MSTDFNDKMFIWQIKYATIIVNVFEQDVLVGSVIGLLTIWVVYRQVICTAQQIIALIISQFHYLPKKILSLFALECILLLQN